MPRVMRPKPAHPEDEGSSLRGLGGYHGSVHLSQPDGGQITPLLRRGGLLRKSAGGDRKRMAVFDVLWKNVVATFYHALNEFRTDPDVEDAIKAGDDLAGVSFLGWISRQGEEIGAFLVFEAVPRTRLFKEVPLTGGAESIPVQFQYSNAVHGPEGLIEVPHRLDRQAWGLSSSHAGHTRLLSPAGKAASCGRRVSPGYRLRNKEGFCGKTLTQ